MLEVEQRSFVSKEQFVRLLNFFDENAIFLSVEEQETHYLDCIEDIRIQLNSTCTKVWLKSGRLHDDAREEWEWLFPREEFNHCLRIFQDCGIVVALSWYRTRHTFDWDGITVCLDFTKDYGYIVELEKLCLPGQEEFIKEVLIEKFKELGLMITPKQVFHKRYKEYKEKNGRSTLPVPPQ